MFRQFLRSSLAGASVQADSPYERTRRQSLGIKLSASWMLTERERYGDFKRFRRSTCGLGSFPTTQSGVGEFHEQEVSARFGPRYRLDGTSTGWPTPHSSGKPSSTRMAWRPESLSIVVLRMFAKLRECIVQLDTGVSCVSSARLCASWRTKCCVPSLACSATAL